jgi:hypothetical protein
MLMIWGLYNSVAENELSKLCAVELGWESQGDVEIDRSSLRVFPRMSG